MNLKEKISIEDLDNKKYRVRVIEEDSNKKAAFTHYIHNQTNDVSGSFKEGAYEYIKTILCNKFPEEEITDKVAEDAKTDDNLELT